MGEGGAAPALWERGCLDNALLEHRGGDLHKAGYVRALHIVNWAVGSLSLEDMKENIWLPLQTIQEIDDSEYLDIFIIPNGKQIAVSTHDIETLTINCTGYELVIVRITAYMNIRTYPDDFKFG